MLDLLMMRAGRRMVVRSAGSSIIYGAVIFLKWFIAMICILFYACMSEVISINT